MALLLAMLLSACQPVTMPQDASAESERASHIDAGFDWRGLYSQRAVCHDYVAMEKGFFAEEGLDVSLEYGFENDYLKLVGVGERQFMVGSGDQVIIGRGQELPVRYVMNWYTRYPVVVFAKAGGRDYGTG